MATVRSSRVSRARYTSPIPPAPSGPTISYGPSLVPCDRPIVGRHYSLELPVSQNSAEPCLRSSKGTVAIEGSQPRKSPLGCRVRVSLGARFIDYVVVDGEFATAPFLHTAGEVGWPVVPGSRTICRQTSEQKGTAVNCSGVGTRHGGEISNGPTTQNCGNSRSRCTSNRCLAQANSPAWKNNKQKRDCNLIATHLFIFV
jgi:hypothetical protein